MTPTEAKSYLANFRNRNFRPYQEEAISWVMESKKKFKFVKARTGFGKSLLAMTCGVMAGDLTYLVQSKFLQTQITRDFPECVSLWGRVNYPCVSMTGNTCDKCCATEEAPCPGVCPYKRAKQKALEAKYRITNFSFFLTEVQYAGRFSGNKFTVIDEADVLENTLVSHVALEFSERSLFRLGLEQGPSRKTSTAKDGLDSWKRFGVEARVRSIQIQDEVKREIELIPEDNKEQIIRKRRELQHFITIQEKCDVFLASVDTDWQLQEIPRQGSRQGQLIFRPTWLTPALADRFLWRHSDSFTLISATFLPLPVECKRLGIDPDEVDYLECPSTFDPERSPVHIWPVASLSNKTMDEALPKVVDAVDRIMSFPEHRTQRGLIHTVSYKLSRAIVEGVTLPNHRRLVTHDSFNRQDVINHFIDSYDKSHPDGKVLISPSAERGLDFRYGLCDFIIVCKMPFLSLGDKTVAARLYGSGAIGKLWYEADAMSTIEQMCGRGNRAEDDTVVCYLLDAQINRVYLARPSLWSESFRESISWDDNLLATG